MRTETPRTEPLPLRKALERAFHLGQTYWQQADHEFISQQLRSSTTLQMFREMADATCAQYERDLTAARIRVAELESWLKSEQPPSALADIADERRRQIEAEGWTPDHDDSHTDGSLALAAACYACHAATWQQYGRQQPQHLYAEVRSNYRWPWADSWWKPKNQRQDLVRAGALIVAEIERLDRSTQSAEPQPSGPTREEVEKRDLKEYNEILRRQVSGLRENIAIKKSPTIQNMSADWVPEHPWVDLPLTGREAKDWFPPKLSHDAVVLVKFGDGTTSFDPTIACRFNWSTAYPYNRTARIDAYREVK